MTLLLVVFLFLRNQGDSETLLIKHGLKRLKPELEVHSMKQTPLYQKHQEAGGKLIDFFGWSLPVQYLGILEEHRAVRERAGLFDVSHMGELLVEGPDALDNLQRLVTNDLTRAKDGQAIYSPMCTETGGVIDDLLLYRFSQQRWLLVVNASNTGIDEAWIRDHLSGQVSLLNQSDEIAQLAVQGPPAEQILQQLTDTPLDSVRFFRFVNDLKLAGRPVLLSRTGYTGEDGFECYMDAGHAAFLWDQIMDAGQSSGLTPAGLGARDTLRFEAALPLYGQELTRDISPLEAGLERFVKLQKGPFVGREALQAQQESGVPRRRIGLEMIDRGIPRAHYPVEKDGEEIGQVTSGTFAPTLGKNCAMALLNSSACIAGDEVSVLIRGRSTAARLVELPFYKRGS